MYPSLETVKQLASQGDYKRIPVCRELFSDKYTPVEVMRMLKKASHHCYLLESASQSEAWGRYSSLGYDPVMEITCSEGEMKMRHSRRKRKSGREDLSCNSSWRNPAAGTGSVQKS